VVPILDQMVAEQEGEEKVRWSPSKVIHRLGKEIDNEESVYYWCYKVGGIGSNPVCPAFPTHLRSTHSRTDTSSNSTLLVMRRSGSYRPTRP
jgi:deoxyhypusine synthase